MLRISAALLIAGSMVGGLQASTIISPQTSIGISYQENAVGSLQRYTYTFTVLTGSIMAGQEIDIQFNPTTTGVLSNGVASTDFNLILLQPNFPPQAPGYYSLLSLVNNPSLASPFRVDFTYTGVGSPCPGQLCSQQFFLYDTTGNLIQVGMTTPAAGGGVPEPSTWWLSAAGLTLAGAFLAVRKTSQTVLS